MIKFEVSDNFTRWTGTKNELINAGLAVSGMFETSQGRERRSGLCKKYHPEQGEWLIRTGGLRKGERLYTVWYKHESFAESEDGLLPDVSKFMSPINNLTAIKIVYKHIKRWTETGKHFPELVQREVAEVLGEIHDPDHKLPYGDAGLCSFMWQFCEFVNARGSLIFNVIEGKHKKMSLDHPVICTLSSSAMPARSMSDFLRLALVKPQRHPEVKTAIEVMRKYCDEDDDELSAIELCAELAEDGIESTNDAIKEFKKIGLN